MAFTPPPAHPPTPPTLDSARFAAELGAVGRGGAERAHPPAVPAGAHLVPRPRAAGHTLEEQGPVSADLAVPGAVMDEEEEAPSSFNKSIKEGRTRPTDVDPFHLGGR
jgi:hypothetical protein